MQWFYAVEGRQVGPVEEPELRRLHREGIIQPQTLVWCPAFADWQPFEAIHSTVDPAAAPVLAPGPSFCLECAQAYPPQHLLRFGDITVCHNCKPVFLRRVKQGTLPDVDDVFAGFWPRFLAKVIDWIILGIFQNSFYFAFAETDPRDAMQPAAAALSLLLWLLGIVLMLGYNTFFLSKFGATPGKMALGLRVVRSDGTPLSVPLALGRSAAEIISLFTIYLGYILVAFDPQRRALHDFIANTRVLRELRAGSVT